MEGDPKVVWAIETKEPGLIPSVVATDTMVVPATATAFMVVSLSWTKSVYPVPVFVILMLTICPLFPRVVAIPTTAVPTLR